MDIPTPRLTKDTTIVISLHSMIVSGVTLCRLKDFKVFSNVE